MNVSRRDVLKAAGLGAVGLAGATIVPWSGGLVDAQNASRLAPRNMPEPFQMRFMVPPVLRPVATKMGPDGVPVHLFSVNERPFKARILKNGLTTTFWGYNGVTPGPTIHATTDQRSILRVRNHLPQTNPILGTPGTTSTHLHGSPSLPQYDGYASDLTPPGFFKNYHYPNTERAVSLWYHDHGVDHTSENVYMGLAAQYLIHDDFERRVLPQGEFDVPLTVRDALFRADGELGFQTNSLFSLFGDVILMNGIPWPVMRVKRRIYRFRMLAAAISRSWRFQLNDGDPVVIVGTDGGLVAEPQTVTQWRQGTAERYEFLIDFARYQPGERVVLHNLSNPNNVDFANTDVVMAFDVTDEPFDHTDPTWNTIPETLVTDDPAMLLQPSDAVRTRTLRFSHDGGQWRINGFTWEDVVNSNFQFCVARPGLNDVEIWELQNPGGGWFHPVHIHLLEFKILDRNGKPPFDFELGPKDVAYTGENETVRLIMRFAPHKGRYMFHCHNLVHEDHDMMGQFGVSFTPGEVDPNDPITAAPPQVDDLPPDPPM
jgi:FtsP/CotA-like multicopper oxidase with cupredoxin domain